MEMVRHWSVLLLILMTDAFRAALQGRVPDIHTEEKAVGLNAVLPCLGWTGELMMQNNHVLVRWLRVLPSGEERVLEELEVPAEPSVLAEKAADQDGIKIQPRDLSLIINEIGVSNSGMYVCHGSQVTSGTAGTTNKQPQLGETVFETKVKLVIYPKPASLKEAPVIQVLSSRAIQVSWQSLDEDSTPINGYLVKVRTVDSNTANVPLEKVVSGNTNITEVGNLWPYTEYTVSLEAFNEAGIGEPSPLSLPATTHIDVPDGKPHIDDFVNGSNYIHVMYKAPAPQKCNGPLLGYRVTRQDSKQTAVPAFIKNITNPNTLGYNFTELEPYTPYMLGIAAYNGAGLGPINQDVIWTDEGLPGSPIITHFKNRTHNMLDVVWERPKEPHGILRGYHVYWSKKDSNITKNATVLLPTSGRDEPWLMYRNYAIHGLQPTTIYRVRVSAFTRKGEGQRTEAQPAITDVAAPGAPRIVNLTANTSNAILLFVHAPYHLHTRVHKYYVRYTKDGNQYLKREFPTRGKKGEQHVELFLDNMLPGNTYQIQVSAATRSLFGPKFFQGAYSEPRVLALSGIPYSDQDQKPPVNVEEKSLATGIIAGVVCTAVLLVLATLVFILIRYRRYLNRRYQFISDPDAIQQNTTLALPDAYGEEECGKESVKVEDFFGHVNKLHADGDLDFSQEYEDINTNMRLEVTSNSSHDQENRNKNRYINIVAYDHSRVILRPIAGRARSDYINANFIDGYDKPRAYIAAQGPLPSTFSDFWRMAWEYKSVVIIMITNLMERGRRKCDQYWPSEGEHQYDHMAVKLLNTYTMAHYTIRVFTLRHLKLRKKTINERVIVQYHYTDWPDHGVPDFTLPSLAFIRRSAAANPPCAGPPIIHCSAGVGRTGTYIVIDSMMRQLKDKNTTNIFKFLSHIRTQRNHLVQTEDQYIFTHDALLEHIQSGDTEVKASKMAAYLDNLLKKPDEGEPLMEQQYKMVTSYVPKEYHLASSSLPINQAKNASELFLPVELSRVCLPTKPGEEGSDYINASYLHGYSKNREFIVTQRPLPATTEDFWRLVWDQNSDLLVLLVSSENAEEESEFWPEKDHPMDCGVFKVTFTEETLDLGYVIREFILESKQDDYECTTKMISTSYWPESCTPLSSVFDLVQAVRNLYTQKEEEGPIVVIDRYGGCESSTFCALYTLYDHLFHEGSVDVYMLAKLYHLKRPGIFPTLESYQFMYKAILTLCADGNIPKERDFGLTNGIMPHYATLTLPTEANGRASSKIISRDETTM